MLKIAYCGFDYFANCLSLLLERDDVEVLQIFACGIGANRRQSAEVVRMAKERKIPYTFHPVGQKDMDLLFDKKGCDYILSAGYSYKIPIGDYRGLNIHPTLLPVGRGPWPFPRIIVNGYEESGVTIHKLTDKFDAGDIVVQRSFPLDENETQDTLHCKNQMLAPELLTEWLQTPDELWNNAVPQVNGMYWKLLPTKAQYVDFSKTPEEINLQLRAFGKAGVYLKIANRKWHSASVFCQSGKQFGVPGSILYLDRNSLCITVSGGTLYAVNIREIKTPGIVERAKRKLMRLLKR